MQNFKKNLILIFLRCYVKRRHFIYTVLRCSGDFILKINAVDPDAGPNGELQYRILPGSDSHMFDLDLRSGALSLAEDILAAAAGRTRPFTVPFEVSDRGTPQLAAKSILTLSPADRALFPVFAGSPGSITLRENELQAEGGLPKFEANGLGQKKEVSYRLAAGNWEDSFQVEERSGKLRLLKGLDHEKVKHFCVKMTSQINFLELLCF